MLLFGIFNSPHFLIAFPSVQFGGREVNSLVIYQRNANPSSHHFSQPRGEQMAEAQPVELYWEKLESSACDAKRKEWVSFAFTVVVASSDCSLVQSRPAFCFLVLWSFPGSSRLILVQSMVSWSPQCILRILNLPLLRRADIISVYSQKFLSDTKPFCKESKKIKLQYTISYHKHYPLLSDILEKKFLSLLFIPSIVSDSLPPHGLQHESPISSICHFPQVWDHRQATFPLVPQCPCFQMSSSIQ